MLYPDLAREIADFNEAYIHHFYFSPATFQPLAERAVKDPSFPLEGMEELRSSQLNCLISHLPVLQSFKTMTRLNKMPIKLHYQLESCFDGLVENLHRAITETKGDSSEVLRAREFARKAHGNQKYGDKPYLHHLERVVEILRPFDNEDLQIIAYLHDVLEDTAITEAEIEQAFGEYIAHSVFLLSDESGRTRKIRKAATNGKLTGVRPPYLPVLIVKAADRLANLRACAADENRKNSIDIWKRGRHSAGRFTGRGSVKSSGRRSIKFTGRTGVPKRRSRNLVPLVISDPGILFPAMKEKSSPSLSTIWEGACGIRDIPIFIGPFIPKDPPTAIPIPP